MSQVDPVLQVYLSPWHRLTTESVKSPALTLKSVDNVERSDSLALGVLGVGDSIADDALEEGLENSTGLFVDHYGFRCQ